VKGSWRLLAATVLASMLGAAAPVRAEDTIKIAYIDPFSGSFAQVGDSALKTFNFILDRLNARGGALGRKFELVTFDSKLQPAEALIGLKSAIDQNIHFVMHCTGSNVGAAMIDAVAKNNARNPDRRVLYLNCGALADELTNEQCDFWHFRFDANTSQRAKVLVQGLPKDIKSVYILNQDYLFGQAEQRSTRQFLAKDRPDIKIVGDELVPLGKVKDFSSYVAKIKASGAQALITGNWGPDLNLLMRAGADAGLDIQYYTYFAHLIGGPTAVGPLGENRLHSVIEFHPNVPAELDSAAGKALVEEWRKTHDFDLIGINIYMMFEMLAKAIDKAGSTDPLKVAEALEGMHAADVAGEEYWIRKDDHQLMEPLYASVFTRGVPNDSEQTGLGWKTETRVEADELALPTICKMKRPSS
jgi:branched-chain amino acid transport system substrate-binding protein